VDPAARTRQILSQVDAYRRNKDFDQAIALLFESVEELPAAREIRDKLCNVLIEAGDPGEAVRQMLAFARWLGQTGDVDGAARLLDEVLLLEPGQHDALVMLRELGYAVPTEASPAAAYQEAVPAPYPSYPQHPYDAHAPLPSYDLEEVGAGAALAPPPPREFAASQLDDPFAAGNGAESLPAFPMDDAAAAGYAPQRDSAEIAVPAGYIPQPPPSMSGGGGFDEEALEEVEFFVAQGMFDEARNLIQEQLNRLPNHPLLLERLRELDEHAHMATGNGSGTRAVPRPVESGGPVSFGGQEDRAFDIAASLDALDALETHDGGPLPVDPNQVSVESVFQQFKAGVAEQISPSDAETHYNLGMAYREMGLHADAVQEFELASRDPGRECVCQSMVGMIHRETGNVDAAIDAFIRAARAHEKTREQECQLTYEIADCYEQQRAVDQAIFYFQRLFRLDPSYDDMRGSVNDRIARLQPAPPPRPAAAKAVGADVDEFDAVLDDLLGSGKLP
jgi:tetratricopeptide (TPR) repeat protein